jgi:hypothetical protein
MGGQIGHANSEGSITGRRQNIVGDASRERRDKKWWRWAESNRRRRGYEPRALTN